MPLVFQLLIYPILDDRTVLRQILIHMLESMSGHLTQIASVGVHCWDKNLEVQISLPMQQQQRADHLEGLPPTFIGVGSLALFLDEDLEYAHRLMRAGVPTELHIYPGAFHGFNIVASAKISQAFVRDQLDALIRAFL